MKSWKIKDGLNKTWIMSNSLYFVLCIDIKKEKHKKKSITTRKKLRKNECQK